MSPKQEILELLTFHNIYNNTVNKTMVSIDDINQMTKGNWCEPRCTVTLVLNILMDNSFDLEVGWLLCCFKTTAEVMQCPVRYSRIIMNDKTGRLWKWSVSLYGSILASVCR